MVQTHLFGWSPAAHSWVEQVWAAISDGRPVQASGTRYASPILATDFADLLWKAQSKGLRGNHNLAGAERASMWQFALALANAAGSPLRTMRLDGNSIAHDFMFKNQDRFSQETSLDSRRIQSVLQTSLPRFREGITRFVEQAGGGHRDRIARSAAASLELSAA
jgi:dTDP-4-dehydrorhamnose reductase